MYQEVEQVEDQLTQEVVMVDGMVKVVLVAVAVVLEEYSCTIASLMQ